MYFLLAILVYTNISKRDTSSSILWSL